MWDRLTESKKPKFLQHLLNLDTYDRYCRFSGFMTNGPITKYVENLDLKRDCVITYTPDFVEIQAASHIAVVGDLAEIGISVDKQLRGKGIGSKLFEKSLSHARLRGACRVSAMCLRTNKWVISQLEKRGMKVDYEGEQCVSENDLGTLAVSDYVEGWNQRWNETVVMQGECWQRTADLLREITGYSNVAPSLLAQCLNCCCWQNNLNS